MDILGKKKSIIFDLSCRKLAKKRKLNPKQAEEIIKIRAKVNNIENRKAVEINQ